MEWISSAYEFFIFIFSNPVGYNLAVSDIQQFSIDAFDDITILFFFAI